MTRRISSSKLKSQFRKINSEIKRVNDANKRAVDKHNREARAHNARVRSNRQRLRNEIARLNSRRRVTVRYVTFQTSVETLHQSFTRLEAAVDQGTWVADDDLLDMAEGETANSVAVLNALLAEPTDEDADDAGSRQTAITYELTEISVDLDARWKGALFALSPSNPEAAQHFCTSAREVLTTILETRAPDHEVLDDDPNAPRTPNGGVSRRAKVHYCLD